MEINKLIIDDAERGVFRYDRSALTSPDILELETLSWHGAVSIIF